jgi:hypothetical protein
VTRLPRDVATEVEALCAEADGAAASGAFAQALARWEAALSLLPAPAEQWGVATSLWAAIADARFRTADFAGALEPILLAMERGEHASSFLHLRRGQCLLEMGHRDAALDALARAYVGAGRALFAGEDPKYLDALREVLPPAPGEDAL